MAAAAIQTIACDGCNKNLEAEDTVYCSVCSEDDARQAVEDATCPHCENMASAPDAIREYATRQRILGFITPEQAAFAEEMATDMERRR